MHSRDEFAGLEFDWFAVDADGWVALFTSAGWGPVPDSVFVHFNDQQVINEQLCRLARIASTAPLQEQSRAFAARGIYAYDWTDTYGPYQRHAALTQPAKLLELGFPTDLYAAIVVLPTVRFSSDSELQAVDLPIFTNIDTRGA